MKETIKIVMIILDLIVTILLTLLLYWNIVFFNFLKPRCFSTYRQF